MSFENEDWVSYISFKLMKKIVANNSAGQGLTDKQKWYFLHLFNFPDIFFKTQ